MTVLPFNRRQPVADIRIGPTQRVQIHGYAGLSPPLVELWLSGLRLNLTVKQAEEIAHGLQRAAKKARGE